MDEGGMSRVPVHLRMLSGGASSELPKRPAVVLKDCAWGRAMGNEKIASGCQFPNCTAPAVLKARRKKAEGENEFEKVF